MSENARNALIDAIAPNQHVLIAGPTASGKSGLALEIAKRQGGVIVNADASQVYDCWQVISARPSAEEEAQAPHLLYGHVSEQTAYSTGHWLREIAQILQGPKRAIIVGGTGLYFKALTQGLADIPATPPAVREEGNEMSLAQLTALLDPETAGKIDLANRARVQRAWEVLHTSGKGLTYWQAQTPPPLLPLSACFPIALDVDRDWLADRIAFRFDQMLEQGALDEVRQVLPRYDTMLPAHKAIGVPELVAHLNGTLSLDAARTRAIIATRQYAKRQRTWLRANMAGWMRLQLP